VLDQHVLKSTSSANQRDIPLTRCAHNFVSRVRIAVWAAGPNDYGRPLGSDLGSVTNCFGWNDPDLDGNPLMLRCMFERGDGCPVEPVIGREIY
jgi:hypothetical protein